MAASAINVMNIRIAILSLLAASLWAAGAGAELLAGTARADITPPTGGAMYGYGARGENVSTGVHDALFAKALVLDVHQLRLAQPRLVIGRREGDLQLSQSRAPDLLRIHSFDGTLSYKIRSIGSF